MVSLQNEAILKLKVQLDSKGIAGTKKLLADLTNAFKAQSSAKGMQAMEQSLVEVRAELKKTKAELDRFLKAGTTKRTPVDAHVRAYRQLEAEMKRAQRGAVINSDAHVRAYRTIEAAVARASRAVNKQHDTHVRFFRENEAMDRRRQATIDRVARAAQRVADAEARRLRQEAIARDRVREAQEGQNRAAVLHTQITNLGAAATLRYAATLAKLKNIMMMNSAEALKNSNAIRQVNNQANNLLQTLATRSAIASGAGFLTQISERLSTFEHQLDAIFRASFRLTMVGYTLRNFGQQILRWGSDIMTTFGDFEYMMLRAAGSLSIWVDAAKNGKVGFTELQEEILTLSKTMMLFPAKDVAEALYFWGSATGQAVSNQEDLAKSTEALDTIMRAAVLTNSGYETTIKGVYSILTQFYGGALEYATEVTEQLFYTTQRTAAEFEDLINSFKMVGPVAAQMGVEFSEVNEIFGILADLGIKGTMAGRGLRQLFIQTLRPSGPAIAAMKEAFAGLSPDVFGGKQYRELVFPEGEYVGITKHIDILVKTTLEMATADRQALLAKIATANELPILTALINKQRLAYLGLTKEEEKYISSATKAQIYFEQAWMALATSWNAAKGSIDRAIESLKIQIGSVISTAIRPFMDLLGQLVAKFEEFVKYNKPVVALISQFGAALAGISIVAGTLFIVAGALAGLGAAIVLVGQTLEPWKAAIGRALGAITLLGAAVVENFDYLRDVAINVMTNLSKAFGSTTGSVEDLAEAIEVLTEPTREVVGFLVRMAAAAVEVASAVAALIGPMGLMNSLMTALSVIISTKLLTGALNLIIGLTGIGRATTLINAGKLGNVGAGILQIGNAAKSTAIRALPSTLTRIGGAAAGMLGGPVGLFAFAATLAYLAYEGIPAVKDWVDSLADSFRDINGEISKVVSGLGDWGPNLLELVQAQADVAAGADEARKAQLDAMTDAIVEGTTLKGLYADLATAQKDAIESTSQAEKDAAQLRADNLSSQIDMMLLYGEAYGNGIALSESAAAAYKAEGEAGRSVLRILEDINSLRESFNATNRRNGEELQASAEDWTRWVDTISRETGTLAPVAAYNLVQLAAALPENITQTELRDFFASYQGAFKDLPWEDFVEYSGLVTNIGAASSAVEAGIFEVLKGIDMTRPANELFQASIAGIPTAMGASLQDIPSDPRFTEEVRTAVANWLTELYSIIGEEWANPGASMEAISADIKAAEAVALSGLFSGIFPDASVFTSQLQDYAFKQDWESLNDIIVAEVLPTGEKLIDALVDGEGLGSVGAAMQTFMKFLVDNGIASPEVIAAVEAFSGEAGEEIAEKSTKEFIDGLVSGYQDLKFDKEAMKAAMKMGTLGEAMEETAKEVLKTLKAAFGRNQNIFTRQLGREDVNSLLGQHLEIIERRGAPGRKPGAQNNAISDFISAYYTVDQKLPRHLKRKFIQEIDRLAGEKPKLIRRLIRGDRDLMSRVFPPRRKDKGRGFMGDSFWGAGRNSDASANARPPATPLLGRWAGAARIGNTVGTQAAVGIPTVDPAVVDENVGQYLELVTLAMTKVEAESAYMYDTGKFLGERGVAGIGNGVVDSVEEVAQVLATLSVQVSSPESTAYQSMYEAGKRLSDGVRKGFRDGIGSSRDEATAFTSGRLNEFGMRGGKVEVHSNEKKTLRIRLEVTSPDGSVNKMKAGDVRRGARDAISVAGLEHFATVR